MRLLYVLVFVASLIAKGSFAFLERSPLGLRTVSRPSADNMLSRNMIDPHHAAEQLLLVQSPGLLLAETDPWVQPLATILDPVLNLLSFAMVRSLQFSKKLSLVVHTAPHVSVLF